MQKIISLNHFDIGNQKPFVLFGGLNVLESKELAFKTAEHFKKVTDALQIPYVFKASFDKANRSSIDSFRGPGLEQGLTWLAEIKKTFDVPIITDVHEINQAKAVAQVADILQIPAFLSRQTDLVVAIAKTGAIINLKKAQFLAPEDMANIVKKCAAVGNDKVMICERGTVFGYHNLIVDMLGFPVMKKTGCPIIFDVTHSLQLPGALGKAAGGRGEDALALARSAMAQGLAGLFLEAHPNPDKAKCDGPSALPLGELASFLKAIKSIDELVKTSETAGVMK